MEYNHYFFDIVSVSVTVHGGPLFNEADLNVTISITLNGRSDDDNSTYIVQLSTEDASAKG